MPAPLCETKAVYTTSPRSAHVAEASENIREGWDFHPPSLFFFFPSGGARSSLWMLARELLMRRSGFVYFPLCSGISLLHTHTHTLPSPSSPGNISRVLAASLHAACLSKPLGVLRLFLRRSSPPSSLFPSSPRQFKQGRVQRLQRGAKSLCRVSVWPRFRWNAHTRTHAPSHAEKRRRR